MISTPPLAQNLDPFCSDISRAANETMFATAPTVKTWFLLEYSDTWHRKATEENDLPRSVQGWLNDQLTLAQNSRLLLIKQARPDAGAGITFFVALCHETSPRLYRFSLADYHALLELDLAAVLAGDPAVNIFRQTEPLYLVCSNGKRDRCCAREGPALYQAMVHFAGDKAWQCTHLGGHRFAPALVTLPDGAFYGRLLPAEAEAFINAHEQGELFLEKLRGRCFYDPPRQAAEQFLRQSTGVSQRTAYRLQNTETLAAKRWAVTFREEGGLSQRITLFQEEPVERLVSCHLLKTKLVAHFQLERHQVLQGDSTAG